MSRPIDADALISKLIDKKYNTLDSKIEFGDIIYMTQTEPTLNTQTYSNLRRPDDYKIHTPIVQDNKKE